MFALIVNIILALPMPFHPVCEAVVDRVENLPDARERMGWCSVVAYAADHRGMDTPLMVELAWAESGFTNVLNRKSGCAGVLQAHPRWTCPNGRLEGCDTVQAGLDAWVYWMGRADHNVELALCHYNSGNVCKPRSLRWARVVRSQADRLRQRTGGVM